MAITSSFGKRLALALTAWCALGAVACGGSTSVLGDPMGSAGTGAAGSPGGGSGGATGVAGSAGAMSAGTGGVCEAFCPAIACANGFVEERLPGQCCPTCVPSGGTAGAGGTGTGGGSGTAGAGGVGGCDAVACIAIGCGPGTTPVVEPGDCCPTCVPDSQACMAGEQGYQTLLGSLLNQTGATSCAVDDDCSLLNGSAQCGGACSYQTVNAQQAPDMNNQLSLWAKSYCSTCTPIYPPCAAPPKPFCEGGQCQLYHAL